MRWRIDYASDEPQLHASERSKDGPSGQIVEPKRSKMPAAAPLSEFVDADRFERLGSQWVATRTVQVIGQPREIVVRRIHVNRVARVAPLGR